MASGISKTKFIRGTSIPKKAGNFSPMHDYYKGLKTKDYLVLQNNKGELIVGNNTPLRELMGGTVVWLALNDPTFEQYKQKSTHTHNGKKYDCEKTLTRRRFCFGKEKAFIYREFINTECEFEYKFIKY